MSEPIVTYRPVIPKWLELVAMAVSILMMVLAVALMVVGLIHARRLWWLTLVAEAIMVMGLVLSSTYHRLSKLGLL